MKKIYKRKISLLLLLDCSICYFRINQLDYKYQPSDGKAKSNQQQRRLNGLKLDGFNRRRVLVLDNIAPGNGFSLHSLLGHPFPLLYQPSLLSCVKGVLMNLKYILTSLCLIIHSSNFALQGLNLKKPQPG